MKSRSNRLIPNIWYVPYYNPAYVWGPPAFGYYPPLLYPGIDVGFGWYPGIDLGLYFGGWGGWGWGGWGWAPDWFGGTIILNHSFFHRYGFSHFHGEPLGRSAWVHDPQHRLGVPYGNRAVANRYSHARVDSIAVRPADVRDSVSSASDLLDLSSAAGPATTASSAAITTAGRRACKATTAFRAWGQVARSEAAEDFVAAVVDPAVAAEEAGDDDEPSSF